MDHFELCVIGGGPSGYAADMRAIDLGKKVLLIEKDKVGGAGVFKHLSCFAQPTCEEVPVIEEEVKKIEPNNEHEKNLAK